MSKLSSGVKLLALFMVFKFVNISKQTIHEDTTVVPVQYKTARITVPVRGSLGLFLDGIGKIESNGDYNVVGGYHGKYLGKYQFSPRTIRAMGFTVSDSQFLSSPELQDIVMITYLRDNAASLRDIIREFDGKVYNGILITKSGILAGAHLIGSGGIKAYFYPDQYSYATSDGNGMDVSVYIERFANFDLSGLTNFNLHELGDI